MVERRMKYTDELQGIYERIMTLRRPSSPLSDGYRLKRE